MLAGRALYNVGIAVSEDDYLKLFQRDTHITANLLYTKSNKIHPHYKVFALRWESFYVYREAGCNMLSNYSGNKPPHT